MKKSLLPLGVVILVVSLLLTVVGPVGAVGTGQLKILKENQDGDALVGATFVISPNPRDWTAEDLTVVDNVLNDDDTADGVLLIRGCILSTTKDYTVTETVAPLGYTPAPPQTTKIPHGAEEFPVTLTFINKQPPVGGNVEPINKVNVLIPWVGLGVIVTGGITWFALKKRST